MKRDTKKIVTRVVCGGMAATMLLGVFAGMVQAVEFTYTDEQGKTVYVDDFRDTQGHWAKDVIFKWAEYDIIQGYQANFMPNAPIKRGDLGIVLDKMMGLRLRTHNHFMDLPSTAYYADAMLRCVAQDYFRGGTGNRINPEGFATREEVAVLMTRVFDIEHKGAIEMRVKDKDSISTWARASVEAMYANGYMQGDGENFNPQARITRAEVIQLFNNIADVYIPRRDRDGVGDRFTHSTKSNVVTARDTTLVRSDVKGDVITTQSSTMLKLERTNVHGRVILKGQTTLNLDTESNVASVVVQDKSAIVGVGKGVDEIHIKSLATETTLDKIPERMYLDPGVRVKIGDIMYENTENRVKLYIGEQIKADISAEQGFIAGGPRIVARSHKQSYTNQVEFIDVVVNRGDTGVREVGLLVEEGSRVPTLKTYKEKKPYRGDTSGMFTIGDIEVKGEKTYRMYTIDAEGLIGYSEPITLKEYDFDVDIKLVNEAYPERIRVDLSVMGESIPDIRTVEVIHASNEQYMENHKTQTLNRYTQPYEQENLGLMEYRGVVSTTKDEDVPTTFGYAITFANGEVVRKFPVLLNAVPEGVAPVDRIETGIVRGEKQGNLEVKGNVLVSRFEPIEEYGVIYREVAKGTALSEPRLEVGGWMLQPHRGKVGVRETKEYDLTIPYKDKGKETQYAAYVKTKSGYYYGAVNKVVNDWGGTTGGPQIMGTPQIEVLERNGENSKVVVHIPVKAYAKIDIGREGVIETFEDSKGKKVYKYIGGSIRDARGHVSSVGTTVTMVLEGLREDEIYTVGMQIYDETGEKSSRMSFDVRVGAERPINVYGKIEEEGVDIYNVTLPTHENYEITTVEILNNATGVRLIKEGSGYKLHIAEPKEGKKQVVFKGTYYIARSIGDVRTETFERVVEVE